MITFEVNETHDIVVVGGRSFEVELATLKGWDFEVDGIPMKCKRSHGPKFIAGLFRSAAVSGVGYVQPSNHKGEEIGLSFNQSVHPISVRGNRYEVGATHLKAVA